MQKFFSFLPRGFASLADYISPSAFDVVDWKAALRRGASVSRSLLFGSEVKDIALAMQRSGLPAGVFVTFKGSHVSASTPSSSAAHLPAQGPGDALLGLYFWQLLTQERCFLDLRSDRFEVRDDGGLAWNPNGLWVGFSAWFREGMSAVYSGFYNKHEQAVETALQRLGLLPQSLSSEAHMRLVGLLEKHFGAGREQPMVFRVRDFVTSFDNLFCFLKDEKIKLSEEFLFLGVMLLTLYMHLEKLGMPLDVKAAYHRVEVARRGGE